MTIAASGFRPANRAERRRENHFRANNPFDRPEAFSFAVTRMQNFGNSQDPIPERIVLLRPNPSDSSQDQLFLDQLPMPRDAWHYDTHDRVLTWKGAFGGGHLFFHPSGRGAVGNIGSPINPSSVKASFTATFSCKVALGCGVEYVTSGLQITGLSWDPTSANWKRAFKDVKDDRVSFSYTDTSGSSIDPDSLALHSFTDLQTKVTWTSGDPTVSLGDTQLYPGTRNTQSVWNLSFTSADTPDLDTGATNPDSVFPYFLRAAEDEFASNIDGAFVIDGLPGSSTAKKVGLQGMSASAFATGYHRTAANAAPFGVFDGRLVIAGEPVAGSFMSGRVLKWQGLDAVHQQRTGLPASGFLEFTQNGAMASDGDSRVIARRLSTSVAIQAISAHHDLYAGSHSKIAAIYQAWSEGKLAITDLTTMTPFVMGTSGGYSDVVQEAVREDLSAIMNSYIPKDMWDLLFPSTPQSSLTAEQAIVANSAVSGVANPTDFYKGLATAVLSQGLARGSEEHSKYLNGPRAAAWLKTHVAVSKVYHDHGQLLFHYRWKERYPQIVDFLNDQQKVDHTSDIGLITAEATKDYNHNVKPTESDPDVLKKIAAEIAEMDTYARTNKTYWAYLYWHYNTHAGTLANLAHQMKSGDSTALSRHFQQNLTVLTSLDPSGYFAQKYAKTINIFLAVTILPSMYGFKDDGSDFDMIKQYLKQWVETNLNNSNKAVSGVAEQLQSILDAKDFDAQMKNWLVGLRSITSGVSSWGSLSAVVTKWCDWFKKEYPNLSFTAEAITACFFAGVTGLAIFNVVLQCKKWDKLDAAERASVVVNACQLGLEAVTAVAVRGVKLAVLYGIEGLSKWSRFCAVGKLFLVGEAEEIDVGLLRLGNSFARWIAGAKGLDSAWAGENLDLLLNFRGELGAVEEVTFIDRVFGNGLEEFMATRIGPLFILAGMALNLYFIIAHHEKGIPLAADIIGLVGGALALFAAIGGWVLSSLAITEGALATCVSFAGPLAILAALIGIALMLYEIFKKPPNPVEEFIDQYAKKAGFYVSPQASSIDYAVPYILKGVTYGTNNDKKDDLLMMGFSLSSGSNQNLICNSDGAIGVGAAGEPVPAGIWQANTDGSGISRIFTVAQPASASSPVLLFLSLMSDGTVSFQPHADSKSTTVQTQHWLSSPQNEAALTPDHDLASINLKFRPVLPDTDGNFLPANAKGWLAATGSGVKIDDSNGTSFVLTMSPLAPAFMTMPNLSFLLGSQPSTSQSWGPSFGVLPSTPLDFKSSGPLPPFLTFDAKTGTFAPNGNTADTALTATCELTAGNAIVNDSYRGKDAKVSFTVTVAAAAG
jgi:hypothetical protein